MRDACHTVVNSEGDAVENNNRHDRTGFILFLEVQISCLFMTFHDKKKSNSMTFRTILGNEHIRSKYGNFKEQHNASKIICFFT